MNKFFFGVLIMILFIACTNNDDEEIANSYPSTLVLTQYETLDNVRVFTKNGEIKDANIIANFIKDAFAHNVFKSKIGVEFIKESGNEIVYKSKDSAFFNWEFEYGKKIPKKVGNQIYFFQKDTLTSFEYESNGAVTNFILQMGLNKPFYQIKQLPYSGGGAVIKYYGARIATGNTDKLEFRTMSYKVRMSDFPKTYVRSSNFLFNNGFDANVIKLMNLGDTLAIQNNKIIFEKLKK